MASASQEGAAISHTAAIGVGSAVAFVASSPEDRMTVAASHHEGAAEGQHFRSARAALDGRRSGGSTEGHHPHDESVVVTPDGWPRERSSDGRRFQDGLSTSTPGCPRKHPTDGRCPRDGFTAGAPGVAHQQDEVGVAERAGVDLSSGGHQLQEGTVAAAELRTVSMSWLPCEPWQSAQSQWQPATLALRIVLADEALARRLAGGAYDIARCAGVRLSVDAEGGKSARIAGTGGMPLVQLVIEGEPAANASACYLLQQALWLEGAFRRC
eukprot:NODE_1593_length_2428_cov_4.447197.p1 GENE.NODE_1593_length_2428_cov_4.447197~~NODE_1593_length_2428_cov_4.447197.p1  ORF type:complete len:307 (-),score=27.50 NODE_1593_length_2428_cov_4.447197:1506-2312(-)